MKLTTLIGAITLFASLFFGSCTVQMRETPTYAPNEKLEKVEAKQEDVDRATGAVARFHQLLNEDKGDELFEWIDPKSQLKSDPVAFHVRVGRIRSELGSVERAELQRSAIFRKSATLEARLEYVTKFSKENDPRPRYELFNFELYPDGRTNFLGYRNGIDYEDGY